MKGMAVIHDDLVVSPSEDTVDRAIGAKKADFPVATLMPVGPESAPGKVLRRMKDMRSGMQRAGGADLLEVLTW